MLHEVPDSRLRERLLEVVAMQRQLMEALCALPPRSTVDRDWLAEVWPQITDSDWLDRFWCNEKDKSTKVGARARWCNEVAVANAEEKHAIKALLAAELRFSELYVDPPTIRLADQAWSEPVFVSAKNLLISFYAPLFYKDEGFPNTDGTRFHKDHFIAPRPKICPYTDNFIQDPKLDHFLPKDKFPMLSCHPDNLVPCSTDANSGSHKGTRVPLNIAGHDQAADWFHPRLRSARETYRLTFVSTPGKLQPEIQFVADDPVDQRRLDNLENMFGLSEFWGSYLDDEVQGIASDIQGWLRVNELDATEETVKFYIRERARQERSNIGRRGLAIVMSYYFEHLANTPSLVAQVLRSCVRGT